MPDVNISVIIPCYNQAMYVEESIESALSQSYKNLEVVLVDDGSTDNTKEVVSQYKEVKYVYQYNQGLGPARNTGIKYSKGKYLVFLDSDDRLLKNAIEIGVNSLNSNKEYPLVYGHVRLIDSEGQFIEQPVQKKIDKDFYLELLKYTFIYTIGSAIIRRNILEELGGFTNKFSPSADRDLYFRITRKYKIYCHDKVVLEYRQHRQSMTNNPALMLWSSMSVHRSQREYVIGDKRLKKAYMKGIKNTQNWYGNPLIKEAKSHFKKLELFKAISDLVVLFRFYPSGLKKIFTI